MKKQAKPEVYLDRYLGTIGLWRKSIAKDGLCLFRAVSEQLFMTQVYHTNLYEACRIVFMECRNLSNMEWSEKQVMEILSRMYRWDFSIYEAAGQPPVAATDNGYTKKILLCRVGENQLDSVYPLEFQQHAAICQSILYELLYREVFKLDSELTEAVSLIRDQNKKKVNGLCNRFEDLDLSSPRQGRGDWQVNIKFQDRSPRKPTPPVPYRIAKALDPCIYRNVELDIWEEEKREQLKESPEYRERFAPGDKCQVILEGEHFHGHIQELQEKAAVVFIEEIGEKQSVLIRCLKTPPSPRFGWLPHSRHIRRRQILQDHLIPLNGQQDTLVPSVHSKRFYNNIIPQYLKNQSQSSVEATADTDRCTNSQGYTLAQAYSYPSMNGPGDSYMNVNASLNQNYQSGTNMNQVTPSSMMQSYIPAGGVAQQQPNPYMCGPMVTQGNQAYSCMCVPYLEGVTVKDVNMNNYPAQDNAEVNTLRFFYNYGVENYRLLSQNNGMWPAMEMAPMITHPAMVDNRNASGQFSVPPPQLPPSSSNSNQSNQHAPSGVVSNQPVHYHPTVYLTYPSGSTANGTKQNTPTSSSSSLSSSFSSSSSLSISSSTKTSKTASKIVDKTSVNEEVADCHDSGCDSDSMNGSSQDDSFKESDGKVKQTGVDLEKTIDEFIAKADVTADNVDQSISSTTDMEVETTPKVRAKKKYYMYGNHKLVKPIKDIPPRFLTLLASSSSERARCEGEPIIIPFLPPRPHRYNSHKYNHDNSGMSNSFTKASGSGNLFNPEAKCFIPGQSHSSLTVHDPSIVAYSGDGSNASSQYVAANVLGGNASMVPHTAALSHNAPSMAVYVGNSPIFPPPSNPGNGCSSNTTPSTSCTSYISPTGDGSKYSMHPFSAGQVCSTYPAGTVPCPMYYSGPAMPYNGAQGYMVPSAGVTGPVNYTAQHCSMPPQVSQVSQVPAIQTAQ